MNRLEYADLYLRLSIDRDGKTAIERQEKDCREWAARNALTVREIHVDRGRSGFRSGVQRRGLDAALAAVTAGIVRTLVVWRLDRFSRQGIGEVGLALDKIEEAGARLVSVTENLDTSVAQDRLLVTTLSGMARAESEALGFRVRSAKAHLRTSGLWIGGQPPYGLVVHGGRLYRDPVTGPVVQEIARRILDGSTLITVTRWLNEEGFPSPRGGEWRVGSVAQLLRGPALAGVLPETVRKPDGSGYTSRVRAWRDPVTGCTVSVMAEGQVPLITPAEQERIVATFAERSRRSFSVPAASLPSGGSRHLLTGLLRCATCGGRMSKQGNSYRCQRVRIGQSCEAPAGAYQPALDAAVTEAWFQRLAIAEPDGPIRRAVEERWMAQHDRESFDRRTALLSALADERRAQVALDNDYFLHRTLEQRRYQVLSAALAQRIDQLTGALEATPQPKDLVSALFDSGAVQQKWEEASVGQRRELLRLALEVVCVAPGVRGHRFDARSRLSVEWAVSSARAVWPASPARPAGA